jgi:hypothetical protein
MWSFIQWNFTQLQRRMKFFHLQVNGWDWRSSSQVNSQVQDKRQMFSLMWNIDLLETQQYYEIQVTLSGGHALEG